MSPCKIKNCFLFFLLVIVYSTDYFAQSLESVNRWAYQLQNISVNEIANNNTFTLIVIDYSHDGSDANKFTKAEIEQIKNSGKMAIAYISIGEAENYRFYWDSNWDTDNDGTPDSTAPAWLGTENPNWPGNYKVKYWNDEWKQIIFNYIDSIMAQGFNGIYCDIIDAYYYWSEEVGVNPNAAKQMIDFISEIRNHVNSVNSNFIIIPQNGEYIVNEDVIQEADRQLYFQSINAIAVEDVFFSGNADENNPFAPDTLRISVLSEYQANNKKIFSVEYLSDNDLITLYSNEAIRYNFIPYRALRALDTLFDGIITNIELPDNFPNRFKLSQNYPNPFNPSTTVKYSLPQTGHVTLQVFDILGRKVAELVNSKQNAGNYSVQFNADKLSSGIYLYKLSVGNFRIVKKMILLK